MMENLQTHFFNFNWVWSVDWDLNFIRDFLLNDIWDWLVYFNFDWNWNLLDDFVGLWD
jgi:hypothetical protein